jgi:hypothetical protein
MIIRPEIVVSKSQSTSVVGRRGIDDQGKHVMHTMNLLCNQLPRILDDSW